MPAFSLLIIVKNRQTHLQNVLRALTFATVRPSEVIIIHMNEDAYASYDYEVRTKIIRMGEALPLAVARNTAAKMARQDKLVFLDVDCIPEPNCFETLLRDLEKWQLSMVDPHYLQHTVKDLDFHKLAADSHTNPARKNISLGKTDRYELFWSLGFAITKADFDSFNGFDENYKGYGGEDTDFAFAARRAGISFGFSKARVYHQNHASYDPPLNWLEDIVVNANHFYDKWQLWPMEGWLHKFADMGYVSWHDTKLELLRRPTESEIVDCLKQ